MAALLINYFRIDHTAIVVANTEASLKFYCDLLGLKLAGESENYGTEQESQQCVWSDCKLAV